MDAVQLDLFYKPKPTRKETIYNDYWELLYGWIPKVGDTVSHNQCMALENLTGVGVYVMMMECVVLEINGSLSIVETTDAWIERCKSAGVEHSRDKYIVNTKALSPAKETMKFL